MRLPFSIATVACVMLAAGSSFADTEVLAHAGVWQAFGGTTNSGRGVCGMSSTGGGKYFGLKYFSGEDTLTVQLGNSQWTVKDKIKVKVMLRFDQETAWNAVAIGMHFSDGDAGLEFDINRKQLEDFMHEFRNADQMLIRFPEEDVAEWRGSLDGTETVSTAFARCVREMK